MANSTQWGTVVSAPDADGFALVTIGDETRRCYFHPAYFADPWPIPEAGDRVAVDTTPAQGREMHATAVIGRGTPTYVFSGES
jgi:hypothetical protein